MTVSTLVPQTFGAGAATQLPQIDFYQYALSQLPQVYQNAPNFCAVLLAISTQKQKLYNIILSLINSYNLNDALKGSDPATPSGIYAQMIASVFNAPYTAGASDATIINATQTAVVFVNSRGYASDFYAYFALTGIASSFTNANVEETGNATIFFNVPIEDTPDLPPNPYQVFVNATLKLKGAGIKVVVGSSVNLPFFQYGSLPTDDPPYQVAPGNAGFGILQSDGSVDNGGFYQGLG